VIVCEQGCLGCAAGGCGEMAGRGGEPSWVTRFSRTVLVLVFLGAGYFAFATHFFDWSALGPR